MSQAYDLAVIGGGSAGSTAAEAADKEGHRVALIERDHLGGTCLNYGCDPTKALLYTAKLLHHTRQAHQRGLRFTAAEVDWTAVQTHIRGLVQKMRGGPPDEAQQNIRDLGIDLFMGEATFQDDHHLKVGSHTIAAENILIATGAKSLIPDIPGLDKVNCLTHKEAIYLDVLPQSMAIIGGGPIGLEFAQIFNRFGVEISLIEAESHLLPHDDPELTQILETILADEGIALHLGTQLMAVTQQPEGKQLTLRYENEYEQHLIVDELLIAVGRKPVLDALKPEAAGIALDDAGWIKVDDTLRTNVPHIWAAGDIWPGLKFTHVAARQGKLAAHNIFAAKPQPFASQWIPWVTYSDPALAHVGATEAELEAQAIDYRIGRYPLQQLPRAVITDQTEGLIKLLIGQNDQVLGANILAPNAGDLIAPLLVAIQGKLPLSILAETIFPYPTWGASLGYAARQVNPL